MIIKKKYTIPKSVDSAFEVANEIATENIVEEIILEKQEEENIPPVKKPKKTIDDLDLSLDNIVIEQREERREGTRRRGYRRTQDRNIVSRAQEEAISIREVAKKEGYEEGISSAQKDLEELKNNFAEFFNYKDEVYEKVSECVLDVAVEIAKKIINKEVQENREYIIPVIKGVIEEINKTENKIVLKVMPKDVEIVREKVTEMFSQDYFEAKISVVPDNEIKEGGVVVETSNGLIDASIETQLSIIEKALKKHEEI